MATFLLESNAASDCTLATLSAEARRATVNTEVAYIATIFVPADETCFHLFDGASAEAVRATTRGTTLDRGRVVAALATERTVHDAWAAEGRATDHVREGGR